MSDELRALPPMVDLRTVARMLGIGRDTCYRLWRADRLPVEVIDLGVERPIPRVRRAELLAYLGLDPRTACASPVAVQVGGTAADAPSHGESPPHLVTGSRSTTTAPTARGRDERT